MIKKLTPKDEEYLRWKEQRDAKRNHPNEEKQEGSKTKGTTTYSIEDGDSLIWIHGDESKGIEICLATNKKLDRTGLLAIGLHQLLQKEDWCDKVRKRAYEYVIKIFKENNIPYEDKSNHKYKEKKDE
tara:strand:- start:10823 stop:11206 length:384 start_codon:yes stop_codon:yes gene_type:complete